MNAWIAQRFSERQECSKGAEITLVLEQFSTPQKPLCQEVSAVSCVRNDYEYGSSLPDKCR